jgi:hypothetical protein
MYIGKQSDVLFYLVDDAQSPVVGLTSIYITGHIWKQDLTVWSPIGILPSEWVELGDGFYVLKLRASLLDRLGSVAIKISGLSIATAVREDQIEPLPPLFAIDASKCVVYGNIMDLTGDTNHSDYLITFTLVSLPQKVAGISLVSSDKIPTRPDAFGNFSVQLLRGTTVLVEIERAGIRNQIVVPCNLASVGLIDLLPPFPSLCP